MTIGKEIVDEFGAQTSVLIEESHILIQMINARIKEIKEKANEAMWATENHYYNLAVDPSY